MEVFHKETDADGTVRKGKLEKKEVTVDAWLGGKERDYMYGEGLRATFQLLQQDRCRQETAINCPDSGTGTRCKAFEGMDRKQSQQRLLPPATWFALIRKLLR